MQLTAQHLEFVALIIGMLSAFYRLTQIEHHIKENILELRKNLQLTVQENKASITLIDYQLSEIRSKIADITSVLKNNNFLHRGDD